MSFPHRFTSRSSNCPTKWPKSDSPLGVRDALCCGDAVAVRFVDSGRRRRVLCPRRAPHQFENWIRPAHYVGLVTIRPSAEGDEFFPPAR